MDFSFNRNVMVLLVMLVEFHGSEAWLVRYYTPEMFGYWSFLLSLPYLAAMACSALEFTYLRWSGWVEWTFWIGLTMCTIGEAIRKLAWVTARKSFSHQIQKKRRENHTLVTTGVYATMRHPGYFGWYVFVVGTQVMMCNPICTVLFLAVGYRFLSVRIPIEERHLTAMFGNEYANYRNRTPAWLPGIH